MEKIFQKSNILKDQTFKCGHSQSLGIRKNNLLLHAKERAGLKAFTLHQDEDSLQFSPKLKWSMPAACAGFVKSNMIVLVSPKRCIFLISNSKVIERLPLPKSVKLFNLQMSTCSRGEYVCFYQENVFFVYRIEDRNLKLLGRFCPLAAITCLCFTPDGSQIWFADENKRINIVDSTTVSGVNVSPDLIQTITTIVVFSNNDWAAIGFFDGEITLIRQANWQKLAVVTPDRYPVCNLYIHSDCLFALSINMTVYRITGQEAKDKIPTVKQIFQEDLLCMTPRTGRLTISSITYDTVQMQIHLVDNEGYLSIIPFDPYRLQRTLLLLCARAFTPDSVFYKEYLPLDIMKVIFSLSGLFESTLF